MDKPTENKLTCMRRKDRAKEDDWIINFLKTAPYIILATSVDNQPFQNINTFVYDEVNHAIYIHTSKDGKLVSNIKLNNLVSVAIGNLGRMLPSKTAMNFSCEFESMIAFGKATIIADHDRAKRALQFLLDKYFTDLKPGKDYRDMTKEEIGLTAVYEIKIDAWSGKKKEAEKDFPGAFHYNG